MNKYKADDWELENIAAQCIFPRLDIAKYIAEESYQRHIDNLCKKGVGGFCIFNGGLSNTKRVIASLQSMAEIPLLFSADFEYGLPMRLDNGTGFPHAMSLGKADKAERTTEIASAIAIEAKSLGIHWNLAPVCDINSNKDNPVINIRAFGENPELVKKHSAAYINGTQKEKVIACAKHFPGHGDTGTDSHMDLPELAFDKKRIESFELLPFANAVGAGVRSIMTGHLLVPAYDTEYPASLSEKITTGILRKKLGFSGLIVTDALDMKAISDNFSSAEAATLTISAGANVVLLPPVPEAAINALIRKAEEDADFKDKLKESANLILKEKKWAGIFSTQMSMKDTKEYFAKHEKLALKTAFEAVCIAGDKYNIPIKEDLKVSGFAFVSGDDIQGGTLFFKYLAQAIQNDCQFGYIDKKITNDEIEKFKKETKDTELVIFAFFQKGKAFQGNLGLDKKIIKAIKSLSEGKKSISVLLGSPYLLDGVHSDTYVYSYSDSLAGIASAIMKLSGRKPEQEQQQVSMN